MSDRTVAAEAGEDQLPPFGHGAVVAVARGPGRDVTAPETSVIRDFLLRTQ